MNKFKEIFEQSIEQSILLTREKHKDQWRKFGNEPYSEHPIRVYKTLLKYTNDETILKAALAHDWIEDSGVNREELISLYGKRVYKLVQELTSSKVQIEVLGKKKYLLNKMMKMSSDALLIKLADRKDNLEDLPIASKKFVDKYKTETIFILKNLKRKLSSSHKKIISEIYRLLNFDSGFH